MHISHPFAQDVLENAAQYSNITLIPSGHLLVIALNNNDQIVSLYFKPNQKKPGHWVLTDSDSHETELETLRPIAYLLGGKLLTNDRFFKSNLPGISQAGRNKTSYKSRVFYRRRTETDRNSGYRNSYSATPQIAPVIRQPWWIRVAQLEAKGLFYAAQRIMYEILEKNPSNFKVKHALIWNLVHNHEITKAWAKIKMWFAKGYLSEKRKRQLIAMTQGSYRQAIQSSHPHEFEPASSQRR